MDMELTIHELQPEAWQAQVLFAPCFEGEKLAERDTGLDKACPWLAIAPALRDFHAEKDEIAVFYGHPDLPVPRVMAIGLGKREDFSLDRLRNALAAAVRKCDQMILESCLLPVCLLKGFDGGLPRIVEESAYAMLLGFHRFSLKSEKKAQSLQQIIIAMSENAPDLAACAKCGEIAAWATTTARELDNLPGNILFPETLALRANELALANGLKCEIMARERLEELGAGCLLGVGQGSSHPPRLIVLEYEPESHAGEKPLVLVGKGITFDSGGLCLKPAANMNQMKCDMSGAAACLTAIVAAARLKVNHRVVAILACAENMPDGGAYRPGDVLTALDGQTVEVINTDAEGRLALADALAYARKFYDAAMIVDIATLTGACAVALGNELAGLFSDDDKLASEITALGAVIGENYWRLPLWRGYRDALKSQIADISHTASREGGAITAALFLRNFVPDAVPWAHLDIAGVDWNSKSGPLCPEGASGFGARTLLELIRRQ